MTHEDASFFVHSSAFIDDNVIIGSGTKVWHFSHIQSGATIGKNCILGQNVNIGANVRIGNGCKIQNNVSIYEGVTLEDEVFCGPSCVFTNDLFPRAQASHGWSLEKTLIKKGASIGANATVVCGHTVGEYALVGAGSVVIGDVKPHALIVGSPARRIGWACSCGCRLDDKGKCYQCDKVYPNLLKQG